MREIFPSGLLLEADASGEHFWALLPRDEGVARINLLYGSEAERMDAETAATLAAFARSAEAAAQVEINGSGGRI